MDSLSCKQCGWKGGVDAIGNDESYTSCPVCGASGKEIIDIENHPFEYDNQVLGNGEFNWNKK